MDINSLNVSVITNYPAAFPGILGLGVVGNALKEKKWHLEVHSLKSHAGEKKNLLDSPPSGGGAGMVLRANVLGNAIDHVLEQKAIKPQIILPSPRGQRVTQKIIHELSQKPELLFICGRFEGIDERIITHYQPLELSLGDFILAGGEIATQAIIEAIVRTLKTVLNNAASLENESFNNNLLEHPQYTQPRLWKDLSIPEVLLSGNHGKIAAWREHQSQSLTEKLRPDLWKQFLDKKTK